MKIIYLKSISFYIYFTGLGINKLLFPTSELWHVSCGYTSITNVWPSPFMRKLTFKTKENINRVCPGFPYIAFHVTHLLDLKGRLTSDV